MLKMSNKEVNKLVNFVDKEFTYDWRYIQAEGKERKYVSEDDVFVGKNYDTDVRVSISKSAYGTYVHIMKFTKTIYSGYLHSFKEVKTFKAMICCLG